MKVLIIKRNENGVIFIDLYKDGSKIDERVFVESSKVEITNYLATIKDIYRVEYQTLY